MEDFFYNFMGNSRNITDTSSRLLEHLSNISDNVYEDKNVDVQIDNAINDKLITTGKLLKFYPSINKCLVELGDGSTKICTNLMLMGGGLMFLYTPRGDRVFCKDMKEACIIPWGDVYVFVAPVNNLDVWVMLGYYFPNDFIGFNPSKQGQFKILAFGSMGEYSIRFGIDGFKIYNNGKMEKSEVDIYGEELESDLYSKEDVDTIIADLTGRIEELESLVKGDDSNQDNDEEVVDDGG